MSPGSKPNWSDDHARQPEAVAQALDRRRDHAEVLGDQRQLAVQRARRGVEHRAPRPALPAPAQRVLARAPAPPSRRRSRGSGRCARGRRARTCAAAARPTSGSRGAASRASRRAGCPTAGPCRCRRRAACRRRAPAWNSSGCARWSALPGRDVDRDVADDAHAALGARTRAARPTRGRSAPGRRPRRAGRSAPSPRSSSRSRSRKSSSSAFDTGARGSASSPGQAANAERRLVGRAVAVGRPERQHLPPRLAGRGEPVDPRVGVRAEAAAGQRGGMQLDAAGNGRSITRRLAAVARWILRPQCRYPTPRAPRRASSSSTRRRPSTPGATPPSASSATRSTSPPTSSATATRSCAPSCATAARAAALGRVADAADRRAHQRRALGGRVHRRRDGPLAVDDRGVERRLRHLARRAAAQGRRRPGGPRRRAVRGRRAARAGRAAAPRAPTSKTIEAALAVLRGPRLADRRRARARPVRRHGARLRAHRRDASSTRR